MKELYSENLATVESAMQDVFQNELAYKSEWAKAAKKCVAFANGDQMFDYIGSNISTNHQPPARRDARDTKGYIGSEIEPIMRTMVSFMVKAKPTVDISAVDDDAESKNVARVADRIMEAKYDLDGELGNSTMAAYWALTTGTTFSKDYWDPTIGSYVAEISPDGQIVKDEQGNTIYSKTSGNNSVAMLSGMSVTLDHSITDPRRLPYIGDSYVVDVDWARECFDRDEPGYTGNASKIVEDNSLPDMMQILEGMKFSVPYLTKGRMEKSKGKCLVKELCLQPTRDFQRGRMIVMAGPEIVYATSPQDGSPYFMELETTEWHPYDFYRYEIYLGRFLGKGLVEQLIPLQMRLNEINKAILKNANRIAKPRLMCTSDQVPAGTVYGDQSILRYKTIPGIKEPYILQGAPLPVQFFNERQNIIDQMIRIAGTLAMDGTPPTGVTAASAIAQIYENSNGQHSAAMFNWEKFHERRYTKKLRIIHKFHQYPDKQLDRYVKTLSKDSLNTEVQDFIGQRDLSDGVVLKIQFGSMIPKSEVARNQTMQDLAKEGLYGPAFAEDSPRGDKLRAEFLEKLGHKPMESEQANDLKKAEWENDRIMKGLPVEISPYDQIAIHLPCHIAKIQDPVFLENATDEQKMALDQHIKAHQEAEAQKQQAAQMQQQQEQQMLADDAHQKEIETKLAGKGLPPQPTAPMQ